MTSLLAEERRVRRAVQIATAALAIVLGLGMGRLVRAQDRFQLEGGQWRKQHEFDAGTPEGQLEHIRKRLAEGKGKNAEKRASKWIERYPNHPLLVEAYLLRGDALVSMKRYFKALFDYEYVIRVYPASEQFNTALDREFEIARLFASGMKRRWLGMRILSAAGEAEEIFIRIQERNPGSDVAERASLALGEFYFNRAEMGSAADAYELFLVNYPDSRFRQRVLLRLIQSNLATFKGPHFDATGLNEAAQRIKVFEMEYPVAAERIGAEALLVRIQESLALKLFYTGRWYERVSEKVSAVTMYQRVAKDHPQTVATRVALQRLVGLEAPLSARGRSGTGQVPSEQTH